MLERTLAIPRGNPKLVLETGYLKGSPWRLQVFVDDDNVTTQIIGQDENVARKDVPANAVSAIPNWTTVEADFSKYAGKPVKLRLYQWLAANEIPRAAYWRSVHVQ